MRVVFCAAEASPFAKVGGLGDVAGSLPQALREVGAEITLVLPRYGCIDPVTHNLQKLNITFGVQFNGENLPVEVWQGELPTTKGGKPGKPVPVYFLENEHYFGSHTEVYPFGRPEFEVDMFRFYSQCLFELLHRLELKPDILHLNDWHTAPMAVDLAERRQHDKFYEKTRSLLTIHNIEYQGLWENRNWLWEGIHQADWVTTVSPTYAQEIRTPDYGAGLNELIESRSERLSGILNGIDTRLFNPETDVFIASQYTAKSAARGKKTNKQALQKMMDLPVNPDVPVIGLVSRLVPQKGLDILLPAMDKLAESHAQFVFLGAGDGRYETWLRGLNEQYKNIRSYIGFNHTLAQQIYAGSDLFLMPSRFEPCGLGQMIAFRYGSVPVVRKTGGLSDTVSNVLSDPESGTGFCFSDYRPEALIETVQAALDYFAHEQKWERLVQRGMALDFSWTRSAEAYLAVYKSLVN